MVPRELPNQWAPAGDWTVGRQAIVLDQGDGAVTEPRLHQLVRQPGPISDRTFEITFLDRGVHADAFTFG
jgi:hypothetical protein